MNNSITLNSLRLGDLIVNPDQTPSTLRGIVDLPQAAGFMEGFTVMGELTTLLVFEKGASDYLRVYRATTTKPKSATTLYEGATSYWAPNLPPVGGAMGELLFRILLKKGSPDLTIMIYRNSEAITFVPCDTLPLKSLRLLTLPKSSEDNSSTSRYSSIVDPPTNPLATKNLIRHKSFFRINKKTK